MISMIYGFDTNAKPCSTRESYFDTAALKFRPVNPRSAGGGGG